MRLLRTGLELPYNLQLSSTLMNWTDFYKNAHIFCISLGMDANSSWPLPGLWCFFVNHMCLQQSHLETLRLHCYCTPSLSVSAQHHLGTSKWKWNNYLGWRRRKAKPTKEPRRKKGKTQRAERGNDGSITWGACVLPLSWQVLRQGLVFLGSELFFQKGSESSICFRAMVWRSVLHLTSWQGGPAEIWMECPTVPDPFPFPRSGSCPAVFKAWVHVADALTGELCLCRIPQGLSQLFPGLCEGRGEGAAAPAGRLRGGERRTLTAPQPESSIMQNEFLLPSELRK